MEFRKDNKASSGRRKFLSMVSAAAAAGLLGSKVITNDSQSDQVVITEQSLSTMPSITFGPHMISRLVCGSNTINGNSYLGHHMDRYMREYFTPERTVKLLLACEQAGITAHQVSMHKRSDSYLRLLWEKGSKMQIISVSYDERESMEDVIRIARPIAIVHHGGVTDRFFAENKSGLVHDYIKKIKDKGLLAGVSAHNPDCIKKIADENWDVDFFTTCFYFLTRNLFGKVEILPTLDVYPTPFYRDDPKAMIQVMQQVKQPCLAFKILAGGRLCSDQNAVKAAFKFTFDNIKPIDGIMVGMFPWYFDEVGADAQYTRDFGKVPKS
jgi:hypothetical protein